MKIGQITPHWIGAKVYKQNWSDCSMTVLDVGTRFVFGQIFDHRQKVARAVEIFSKNEDDWFLYVDAEKLISLLPVRDFDER